MQRSYINTLFYTLLFSGVVIHLVFLFTKEVSWFPWLVIRVCWYLVRTQDYLYSKNECWYFRRVPFSRGEKLQQLKSIKQLRLIDSEINQKRLWQNIQRLRQ